MKSNLKNNLEFFSPESKTDIVSQLYHSKISAGFPSPAEDYVDLKLDLNKHLVKHPHSTFYAKVKGNSMIDANIQNDDILIIDKSLRPTNGSIAVCIIDGEFTVKRIRIETDKIFLVPENPKYKTIEVTADNDFRIWGIVTYIIHKA